MNLFVKIFLWFLAAMALMVGVALFLTWGLQSDPFISRFQNSARNQIRFHADTLGPIIARDGMDGAERFLERLNGFEPIRGAALIDRERKTLIDKGFRNSASIVIDRAFDSDQAESDFSPGTETVIASRVLVGDGRVYVLAVHWSRPLPPPFLGEPRVRYLRLLGLLITAILVCYALARYLTSPIVKLGTAAREFAAGNLTTRVAGTIGKRRDEFGKLAADFDEMAERIESLLTSEKRLTRDISHELRSPLARMNVALGLARKKAGDEAVPILDRIEKEAEQLNEMIGKLLTLSKLERGTDDISMVRIDLSKLVRDISADAEFEAVANDRMVRCEIGAECRIIGSEYLLRSAVENVVRNAVRYTQKGTSVDVALAIENETAAISVEDHGDGAPDGELENLFRPFYRVGEARERRSGGVGLGLAIARRAVIVHHGSIVAENTGTGLKVTIKLPLNDERR